MGKGRGESGPFDVPVPNDNGRSPLYDSRCSEDMLDEKAKLKNDSMSVEPLSLKTVFSYGMGTIFNDMSGACWFSYLLYYLSNVKNLPGGSAGTVILAGQLADAVATPLCGYLCDKSESEHGRRKTWIAGGSLVVALCFGFVFGDCFLCEIDGDVFKSSTFEVLYYAVFASLFNFGWAAVQVSHMTLVTELSPCESQRCRCNGARFAGTVSASLSVYFLVWAIWEIFPSWAEAAKYETLGICVIVIGLMCTVVLMIGVKEPPPPPKKEEGEHDSSMTWKDWFSVPLFYWTGMIYMSARILLIVFQTLTTFYVLEALHMPKVSMAQVPLVSQIASFAVSPWLKDLNDRFGRRTCYVIGCGICGAAALAMYVLPKDVYGYVFGISFIMGVGTATVNVGAFSMVADLVGDELSSGAFVYGAFGFLERLSTGMIIFFLNNTGKLKKGDEEEDSSDEDFIRMSMGIIPAVTGVFAIGCTIMHYMVSKTHDLDTVKARKSLKMDSSYQRLDNEA
eukprot:GFYU01001429.1.p1 GENE.GFYU01001429.1~~GFYU01001429.1.p1  ORF type:complete len:508 (+),score=176.94 GFYU01001429.1:227-1750(+)